MFQRQRSLWLLRRRADLLRLGVLRRWKLL
jgi:hypothetical protein